MDRSLLQNWKKRLEFGTSSNFEKKSQLSILKSFEGASGPKKDLAKASIVIVGDNRLVPNQAVEWIQLIDKHIDKNWVWITDRFSAKQQKKINQFISNRVSFKDLAEFFEVCGNPRDCVEGSMLLVLKWIKKKKVKIHFCKNRKEQSAQTQELYRQIIRHSQKTKVFAWTGSLKTAPVWSSPYLSNVEPIKVVLINMDTPPQYHGVKTLWMKAGRNWVYTKSNSFLSLELLRLWNEHQVDFINPINIKPTINNNMEYFSKIMNVLHGKKDFRLLSPFIGNSLKIFSKDAKVQKFIDRCLKRGESAIIPSKKLIIICRLDPASVAEEAMHYLRLHQVNQSSFGPWVSVWEEAWGMFGSLCIDPNRKIHSGPVLSSWEKIHQMGYELGMLFFNVWKNPKNRKLLRKMFLSKTVDEQKAKAFIQDAYQRLQGL